MAGEDNGNVVIPDEDVPLADGNEDVAPLIPEPDYDANNAGNQQGENQDADNTGDTPANETEATKDIVDEETPLAAEAPGSSIAKKFPWWILAIISAITGKTIYDKANDKGIFKRKKATNKEQEDEENS